MKKLLLGSIAFLLLAGTIGSAGAHSPAVVDPDDSEGPLDIVYAVHSHKPGKPSALRLRIGTYESWQPDQLSGEGRQFFSFEFHTDRDGMPDRRIMAWERDGVVAAEMYGQGFGEPVGEEQLGAVRVWRPDDHSLKVVFHQRLLGRGIDRLRWRGVSSFERPGHETCRPPEPHGDGGYGTCSDFTRVVKHE